MTKKKRQKHIARSPWSEIANGSEDIWSVALTDKIITAAKKVIKEIEREQPTPCTICGIIKINVESMNRKGDRTVARMVTISRDTEFVNPYFFSANSELSGQNFHYPLGYKTQVVAVSPKIYVKDRYNTIDNPDFLTYEISRRLIRNLITKLENNVFSDCAFYDHRLAMVETAKEIIRENSELAFGSKELKKLAASYGFWGVFYDILFEEAYNELKKTGEIAQ